MSHGYNSRLRARISGWDQTWALALAFGLASVPWTYAFVVSGVPLWPSFIASASFYAAGGSLDGLKRASASNAIGILYATATIAFVTAVFDGGVLPLSITVGAFMLLATLHDYVPLLSFTPGGFFGYATMFSVHAAEAAAFGISGLAGETVAATGAMFIGAVIGYTTEWLSEMLA